MVLPAYKPDAFTEAAGQSTESRRETGVEHVSASGQDAPVEARRMPRLRVVLVLVANGRRYSLRGSFGVFVRTLNGGETVLVEYPPLGLAGYGSDDEEAMAMFADAFDAMYQRLVADPNAKLTAYARGLRQRLSNLVVNLRQL